MRLIDADALNERMYHDAFEVDSDMQRWDSGCWIRYKMFENAIDDAPTIEPERKTGRWIKMSDSDGGYWACSECGKELMRIWHYDAQFDLFPRLKSIDRTKHCPNCGADMRGKTDEVN